MKLYWNALVLVFDHPESSFYFFFFGIFTINENSGSLKILKKEYVFLYNTNIYCKNSGFLSIFW